jgi:hypothetical protein
MTKWPWHLPIGWESAELLVEFVPVLLVHTFDEALAWGDHRELRVPYY